MINTPIADIAIIFNNEVDAPLIEGDAADDTGSFLNIMSKENAQPEDQIDTQFTTPIAADGVSAALDIKTPAGLMLTDLIVEYPVRKQDHTVLPDPPVPSDRKNDQPQFPVIQPMQQTAISEAETPAALPVIWAAAENPEAVIADVPQVARFDAGIVDGKDATTASPAPAIGVNAKQEPLQGALPEPSTIQHPLQPQQAYVQPEIGAGQSTLQFGDPGLAKTQTSALAVDAQPVAQTNPVTDLATTAKEFRISQPSQVTQKQALPEQIAFAHEPQKREPEKRVQAIALNVAAGEQRNVDQQPNYPKTAGFQRTPVYPQPMSPQQAARDVASPTINNDTTQRPFSIPAVSIPVSVNSTHTPKTPLPNPTPTVTTKNQPAFDTENLQPAEISAAKPQLLQLSENRLIPPASQMQGSHIFIQKEPMPNTGNNDVSVPSLPDDAALQKIVTSGTPVLSAPLLETATYDGVEITEPTEVILGDTPRADTTTPRMEATNSRPEIVRHVAQQLVEVARQLPDRPVELSLNPEELGRVRLTFTVADGGISIAVVAERGDTTDLLRRHIDTLAQEFRDLGYREVNIHLSQNGRGNSGGDHSHNAEHNEAGATPAEAEQPSIARLSLGPLAGLDLRL